MGIISERTDYGIHFSIVVRFYLHSNEIHEHHKQCEDRCRALGKPIVRSDLSKWVNEASLTHFLVKKYHLEVLPNGTLL